MTTPATITTEELDALERLREAAGKDSDIICTKADAQYVIALRNAAPRLIEQARKWIEAESQDYNPDQHAYGLMWQERNKEAMRAICAESALSATRERLEIAVEALEKISANSLMGAFDSHVLKARAALSAIAAKACTGGKGEGT